MVMHSSISTSEHRTGLVHSHVGRCA